MNVKRAITRAIIALVSVVFIVGFVAIIFVAESDSSSMRYRTLDYDVSVQANGDLKIVETVDIQLNKRSDGDDGYLPWRQLYQTYTLNSTNLTNITDVSVKNLTTGETYTQGTPQQPSYLVNGMWDSMYAGHWYMSTHPVGDSSDITVFNPATDGLQSTNVGEPSTSKSVEIGWNIPATKSASSLKFQIAMTWQGVATAYEDVVKFQWEPLGMSNEIPIDKLTATVTFPTGVTDSNSWAWLHYEGASTTQRGANGELIFTADNVSINGSGDYVDLVAMFAADKAHGVIRTEDSDAKQWTIDSETSDELAWRAQQQKEARIKLITWIAVALVGIVLCVFACRSAIRNYHASQYHGDIEYWREPPNMSPASAAKLDSVLTGKVSKLQSRQLSATMLSLVTKGAIAIYPGPAQMYVGIDLSRASSASIGALIASDPARSRDADKTSTIVILPVVYENKASLALSQSEDAALNLLLVASRRLGGAPVFDLTMMNKSFKKWEDGYLELNKFTNACASEYAALGATKVKAGSAVAGTFGIMLGFFSAFIFAMAEHNLALVLVISAPILFVCMFALLYSANTVLTEQGQVLAGQVQGLRRFLLDFSDFTDRGVLDTVLWGRYLVYATAFGISKEALAQLVKAYPQVADPNWVNDNIDGMLLYWSLQPAFYGRGGGFGGNGTPTFNGDGFMDLGSQISSGFDAISHTIQAASPSSSSGGGSGGSFSGGGGFGGSSGGSGGGSFGGR